MKDHEFQLMAEQEASHWWYEARSRLLEDALAPLAGNGTPLRILDLASACGGNFEILGGYGHAVGLDISSFSVRTCASRGATMVQGDAQRLPFGTGTLDVVVALDVFEHLPDDAGGMAETFRVLRPGGTLVFNVPACPALFSDHDRSFDHFRRYRLGDLRSRLQGAGYQVMALTYWSFFIFIPVFVVRRLGALASRGKGAKSDFHLPVPGLASRAMGWLAALERQLINRGVNLPWGVSIYGYARKPA